VCISRQRNSGYKAEHGEQVTYRGTRPLQFPPSLPPLTLIHTSLSKERVAQHLFYSILFYKKSEDYGDVSARAQQGRVRQVSALIREDGRCHLVKKAGLPLVLKFLKII